MSSRRHLGFGLAVIFVGLLNAAPAAAAPKTTVIFDLGGVMVGDADAGLVPFLADLLQVSAESVRSAFPAAAYAISVGQQTEEEVFRAFVSEHGGELPADWQARWEQHYLNAAPMRPAMQHLVRCLQANGYATPLLSDTSPLHAALNKARGAYAPFAPVLLSHETHRRKPDPKTYLFALEAFGVEADSCVFVDDRAANVAGAQSVGIDSIVFDGLASLQAKLEALGVQAHCPPEAAAIKQPNGH